MNPNKAFPGVKIHIRQGASHALGTIIDEYLKSEENALLYLVWQKTWPTPLEFPGNTKAITCEQVLEVPEDEFVKAFKGKNNKQIAARIRQVAAKNAGR